MFHVSSGIAQGRKRERLGEEGGSFDTVVLTHSLIFLLITVDEKLTFEPPK